MLEDAGELLKFPQKGDIGVCVGSPGVNHACSPLYSAYEVVMTRERWAILVQNPND